MTCTHVMCDDASVNVCSVYFNIINSSLPTCFVWGISNQYYMVIALIFYNSYLCECIYITFNKYIHILYVYRCVSIIYKFINILFDNIICSIICSE